MKTIGVSCPSGLTGEVRGLSLREESMLTNQKWLKSGKTHGKILDACWVETHDFGPYQPTKHGKQKGQLNWSQVLTGDRIYAILQVFAKTYTPHTRFSTPCKRCDHPVDWSVDVTKLEVRGLSDDIRETFTKGNRYEMEVPAIDRRFWIKLMTGADEAKLAERMNLNPHTTTTQYLLTRIVEVEGQDPNEPEAVGRSIGARLAFIESLGFGESDLITEALDALDPGVHTTLHDYCSKCGLRQEMGLPFDKVLEGFKAAKSRQHANP